MKIIQIVLLVVLATTLFVAQSNWEYAATYPERREIVLKQGEVRWKRDASVHIILGYEIVGCTVEAPSTGIISDTTVYWTAGGRSPILTISGEYKTSP